MKTFAVIFGVVLIFAGCKNENTDNDKPVFHDVNLVHSMVGRLNDVVIYEIFAPPVASRIYAYSTLALYEASRGIDTAYKSITEKLNGFPKMPVPTKGKLLISK